MSDPFVSTAIISLYQLIYRALKKRRFDYNELSDYVGSHSNRGQARTRFSPLDEARGAPPMSRRQRDERIIGAMSELILL